MAKSEIGTTYVRQVLENLDYWRANPQEYDFAISISFGECQLMARLIMSGSPVSPLIDQDF